MPPAREFLTSAGFGGLTALLAAIIVATVLLVAVRRNRIHNALVLGELEGHHDKTRTDQQRDAALERCWRRLEWVVGTAGIEPASSQGVTLGLGPELATEVLRGILREADELGDAALGEAAAVHLSQFSLVLAQQGGPLTRPTPAKTTTAEKTATTKAASDKPASPTSAPAGESAPTAAGNSGSRRRS